MFWKRAVGVERDFLPKSLLLLSLGDARLTDSRLLASFFPLIVEISEQLKNFE